MSQDPNPPSRPMPAFLQNLMQANQNVICTAKGEAVRKASIEDLFRQRLRIPIFQRRYCWGEDQWKTLLDDAMTVVSGAKEKHSLGRITCVKRANDDGRLLVIDGQQRNTTCSLLLAAIRDIAVLKHVDDPKSPDLVSRLDASLFSDLDGLGAYLRQSGESSEPLADGDALEFAALVPTYCDRSAYFTAVLPPSSGAVSMAQWQRPLEAKKYFLGQMQDFDIERLSALTEVVLHKLEWLLFPIDLTGDHKDGTEDLQVIFERLAVRDATFCKPSRSTEFASMGAADFVRNLLLGSFSCEADAIAMYKQHWLPIEQAAAAAATRGHSSNIALYLEGMLDAFLKAQPEKLDRKANSASLQSVVGGQLYPRFRQWLTAALAVIDEDDEDGEDEAPIEQKTIALLKRLQAFALERFANDTISPANPDSSAPAPKRASRASLSSLGEASRFSANSAKWRCTRCSFPNDAGSMMCTACCLQRVE